MKTVAVENTLPELSDLYMRHTSVGKTALHAFAATWVPNDFPTTTTTTTTATTTTTTTTTKDNNQQQQKKHQTTTNNTKK